MACMYVSTSGSSDYHIIHTSRPLCAFFMYMFAVVCVFFVWRTAPHQKLKPSDFTPPSSTVYCRRVTISTTKIYKITIDTVGVYVTRALSS